MATGLGGGGLPRIKELLAYLKALNDTVFTTAATTKAARVNLRDALGNELGTAAGTALKVDVSGDFPDNIQGAVENGVADIDPNLPGHRVKPVKIGSRANAAAPTAVAENQITDAWFDLYGRMNVAMSDGSLVTLGAIADAVVAADASGSISAKLRRVTKDLDALHTTVKDIDAAIIKVGEAIPANVAVIGLNYGGDAIPASGDSSGNLKTVASVTPVTDIATGIGAIAMDIGPAYNFYLHSITLHFSAAPTTAENLTMVLEPTDGVAYNTMLLTMDPSIGSTTDVLYQLDSPLLCMNGDVISIAYTNTDAVTYGLRVITTPA